MPDIDYGQILEALNDKTDRDLGNLSAEGRVAGGGLAFPGTAYVDLTINQSGGTYVAPASGYFAVKKRTNSNMASCYFIDVITGMQSVGIRASGDDACCFLPVPAGRTVELHNSGSTGSITYLRFIYAEGSNN